MHLILNELRTLQSNSNISRPAHDLAWVTTREMKASITAINKPNTNSIGDRNHWIYDDALDIAIKIFVENIIITNNIKTSLLMCGRSFYQNKGGGTNKPSLLVTILDTAIRTSNLRTCVINWTIEEQEIAIISHSKYSNIKTCHCRNSIHRCTTKKLRNSTEN